MVQCSAAPSFASGMRVCAGEPIIRPNDHAKPHVDVKGAKLLLVLRQSGVKHEIDVSDRRLANIIRKLPGPPGRTFFSTKTKRAKSECDFTDVNDYLQEITGEEFTAKDFRLAGTVLTAMALMPGASRESGAAKKNVKDAIAA